MKEKDTNHLEPIQWNSLCQGTQKSSAHKLHVVPVGEGEVKASGTHRGSTLLWKRRQGKNKVELEW